MRSYQSCSSVNAFLSCPQAYKLRYVDNVDPLISDEILTGKYIHDQLEKQIYLCDYDAKPYRDALDRWLEETSDLIIETEKKYQVELPSGKHVVFVADAITKNGLFLEYKITKSPGYYKSIQSRQIRLYTALLHMIGLDYHPVGLLFEYKTAIKNKQPYPKLVQLHVDYPVVTEMQKQQTVDEFSCIVDMIGVCDSMGSYPPSYSNCARCFYKEECDFYMGF